MANKQKMTVGRFLKRNALYFFAVAAVLLLIGVVVFGVLLVRELRSPAKPAETVQQETVEPETPAEPEEEPEPEPEPEVLEPGWQSDGSFVPPFSGTTTFLVGQSLALTYDSAQLKLSENGGLYTLSSVEGGSTPRMDMQQMMSSLEQLSDEELDRLAAGVLQAYYYVAPKTEDILLSDVERTENSYYAHLGAPAYENAPAMEADFRLIQAGGQLWYAIVLLPEGADVQAFQQAFDNLMYR